MENIILKRAGEVKIGDRLVEKDGYLLTVANVSRDGTVMTFYFEQNGMIPIQAAKVRDSAKVRVLSEGVR